MANHAMERSNTVIELSSQLIQQHGENALLVGELEYYRALAYAKQEKSDLAIKSLQSHLDKSPISSRTPSLLFFLGTLHLNRGQTDEAIAAFNRLRSHFPDSPYTHSAERFLHSLTQAKEMKR